MQKCKTVRSRTASRALSAARDTRSALHSPIAVPSHVSFVVPAFALNRPPGELAAISMVAGVLLAGLLNATFGVSFCIRFAAIAGALVSVLLFAVVARQHQSD